MSAPAHRLTATALRAILATVLVLVAGMGVVVFVLGYQRIIAYANSTAQTAKQADASSHVLQDLNALRAELDKNADAAKKSTGMIASSSDYAYQEQIIETVTSKAMFTGVALDNVSFTSAATSTTSGGAGTATSGVTPTPAASASLPAGLRTAAATVTLKNPVDYNSLLNFLYSLEHSVPSISVSSVDLTKSATASGGGSVVCGPLNIEVYIR